MKSILFAVVTLSPLVTNTSPRPPKPPGACLTRSGSAVGCTVHRRSVQPLVRSDQSNMALLVNTEIVVKNKKDNVVAKMGTDKDGRSEFMLPASKNTVVGLCNGIRPGNQRNQTNRLSTEGVIAVGIGLFGPMMLVSPMLFIIYLREKNLQNKIRKHAPDLFKLEGKLLVAYKKLSRINSVLGEVGADATYRLAQLQLKEGIAALEQNRFWEARDRAARGLRLIPTLDKELSAF